MIRIDVRFDRGAFQLNVALEAPSDGVIALFGRSGAGKSTLLETVAGLLRPDSGRIALQDEVLFDSAAGIDVPVERRRLGVVFQSDRLFPHLSARANLLYGMPREPDRASQPPSFDDVVDLLGLAGLLDRLPRTLSGGERQRVAIGRALLSKPRALLMDEPLAALDGARKAEILPMLADLRALRRVPILYVSHQMDEVVRLADTLVLISDGRVAAVGPVEDITSRLDLRPLTGRHEAGSVLRGTVRALDRNWGLADVILADGLRLTVPAHDLTLGASIRVRIRARDVALSLGRPEDSSVLNTLPGIIAETSATDGPHVDIRLTLSGDQSLWARVTRKSAESLGLSPGRSVFALIKTVAIDRHSVGHPPADMTATT